MPSGDLKMMLINFASRRMFRLRRPGSREGLARPRGMR
jgi:hypothetical protein